LQLAPELPQGSLDAVALNELDLCHCIAPEKEAADSPDGEPAAPIVTAWSGFLTIA
jgi:hypothetical protein